LFIISINISASSEKNIKGDRIAIKEKLMIKGIKKRGKTLKRINILDNT
jgi:hypothetical protein